MIFPNHPQIKSKNIRTIESLLLRFQVELPPTGQPLTLEPQPPQFPHEDLVVDTPHLNLKLAPHRLHGRRVEQHGLLEKAAMNSCRNKLY